jgi:hypothetical protein
VFKQQQRGVCPDCILSCQKVITPCEDLVIELVIRENVFRIIFAEQPTRKRRGPFDWVEQLNFSLRLTPVFKTWVGIRQVLTDALCRFRDTGRVNSEVTQVGLYKPPQIRPRIGSSIEYHRD